MKTACKILGHRLDVDSSYYYGLDICTRCQEEFIGQPLHVEYMKVRAVVASRVLRDWALWLSSLPKKCPDCGKRWGRHDDSQDHLPF